MTLRTNSRVAGSAFLVYIAAAMTGLILSSRAAAGEGAAAKLANIALHASQMRLAYVLELVGCFCALVLAVTLYAITRDEDRDLALLAAACRVAEGVIGAAPPKGLQKLWLATGAEGLSPATGDALAAFLLKMPDGSSDVAATFFAVGSTIFACLFLRGRIVPVALAGLGVGASILTVLCLLLRTVGILGGPMTELMWLPMLVFEVSLALWLIFKGAAAPRRLAV